MDVSIAGILTIDGLTNAEVEQLFCAARDADYMAVATEARQMLQLKGADKVRF